MASRALLVVLAAWFAACLAVAAPAGPEDFPSKLRRLEAVASAEPTNAAVRLELGRAWHWEGTLGRKHAGDEAERWLRACLALSPTNAFARALLGSALTLQARDAVFPPNRLRLAKAGLAEMDAAVRQAPEDPDVRFTRASNNLFLPAMFKREPVVKSDFAWLDEQVRKRGKELGTEFCQWTRCFQGIALRKAGDAAAALALWRDALALDPKTDAARRIREECRCDAP